MNYWSLSFLIFLFACNLNSDAHTSPDNSSTNPPTRRELFRKQFELKEIHLITSEGNTAYTSLWNTMQGEIGRGMKPQFSTDDKWDEAALSSKVVFLVGTVSNHRIMREMYEKMPFSYESDQLNFADQNFNDPSSIIKISLFPNPLNPNIPIYWLSGTSDEQIVRFIKEQYQNQWRELCRASFGYQIFDQGKCKMTGFFSEDNWEVDKKLHWDFTTGNENNLKTEHFEFIDHSDRSLKNDMDFNLKEVGKRCEEHCAVIAKYFGKEINSSIQYHVYDNMERKGLMTNNTAQSHIIPEKKEVHVNHSKAYLENNLQLENQFFINEILGEASQPWLANGTSIFFAEKWQRFGFKHWSKKLLASNNLPALSELIDNSSIGFESPIILGAGQAALVDYLLTIWGKDKFATNYMHWKPSEREIQKLEPGFRKHISNYTLITIPSRKRKNNYLKGFNFAHEGYQIYNGYGSTLSQKSLEGMKNLGSNSMALVPYSYMRDPKVPSNIPIVDNAGSETDESLIQSIQHAKELNMTTVMKPQLWLGKSWTGFIEMSNPEDWDTFFENYYRWIRHFAILSEIYEVDVFSVGVEFVQATLQNEAAWKKMFAKIRPLFSGEMTYCANWGDEFEQLSFWEPLDFIGINCYYPLSKSSNPSQKELNNSFAEIAKNIGELSQRFNKKVIFTEIGFRSVKDTWKHPHAEADGRIYDEQAQVMCYKAVFENIAQKEWCDGILWWKWPSYLDYSRTENTRFTPSGKKTEQVVKKWFNTLEN